MGEDSDYHVMIFGSDFIFEGLAGKHQAVPTAVVIRQNKLSTILIYIYTYYVIINTYFLRKFVTLFFW